MRSFLHKLAEAFAQGSKSRFWRGTALFLACVVTFATTYALILPAITIEYDTAENMPGFSLVEDAGWEDEDFELILEEETEEIEGAGIVVAIPDEEIDLQGEIGEVCPETEAEAENVPEDETVAEDETVPEDETGLEASSETETDLILEVEEGEISSGLIGEAEPPKKDPFYFLGSLENLDILVEVPGEALPEDTVMVLSPVEGEELREKVQVVVEDRVKEILAIKVTFLCEGKEIQPTSPIKVALQKVPTEGDQGIVSRMLERMLVSENELDIQALGETGEISIARIEALPEEIILDEELFEITEEDWATSDGHQAEADTEVKSSEPWVDSALKQENPTGATGERQTKKKHRKKR